LPEERQFPALQDLAEVLDGPIEGLAGAGWGLDVAGEFGGFLEFDATKI
jgi:hypothetical protein